jgi:hypothetical protein
VQRPSQFSPQTRAGPVAGGQAGAEHEARERSRETAYRPDGSVAGTREWERWRVWRQPVGTLQAGSPGIAPFGFIEAIKEFVLLWTGAHCLLAVAIAGGALAKWSGHNPIAGYVLTCFLMYWFFIRPRL